MTLGEFRTKQDNTRIGIIGQLPGIRAEAIKQLRKLAEYETDSELAALAEQTEAAMLRIVEAHHLHVGHISRNINRTR